MELGNFSVSLKVQEIGRSFSFYEALGFEPVIGSVEEKWMVLRNGPALIGLYEGMLEKNLLTFNPGWDTQGQPTGSSTDIRDIQRVLEARGEALIGQVEGTSGPGSFTIEDPDGNRILFDQHV